MTVTVQDQIAGGGEQPPSCGDVKVEDSRAAYRAGQKAFKELTAPIRGSMALAQVRDSRSARRGTSGSSSRGCLS